MDKGDEIIWSFEHCRKNPQSNACASCKYGGRSFQLCEQLADDVIHLLEARKPKMVNNIIGTSVSAIGDCPSCGRKLNTSFLSYQMQTKFCYNCGQEVKWHA